MTSDSSLPSTTEKPSLLEWLETLLPFRFPRIPFVRTAANLDKAAAAIALASGDNVVARIQSSTNRIKSRSNAEQELIEFGQAQILNGPSTLANRAIEYAIGDALRKQANRETILEIAADHLSATPPIEDAKETIDDDWLDAFKRYAETKSGSDIQQLWARILSSEIRKPGSTSLRTLSFLSTISSSDAKFIVSAFRYVVDAASIPGWAVENKKIPYGDMLTLLDLGTITGTVGIDGPQIEKSSVWLNVLGKDANTVLIRYFQKIIAFTNSEKAFKVEYATAPLTSVGKELFVLTDSSSPDYEMIEQFAMSIRNADVKKISKIDIVSVEGRKLHIANEKILFEEK